MFLKGLADGQLIDWTQHRYVRTIQGHKQQDGTSDQDQSNQHQTDIVQQAQALLLHDRRVVAHQQNGNHQPRRDVGGDDIGPEDQLNGIDAKERNDQAHHQRRCEHQVEPFALPRALVHGPRPAHGFRHRVGGTGQQHGNGHQARPDEASRKEVAGQGSGERFQGARRICRRVDVLVMHEERRGGADDWESPALS